jgi:hypothetical protein
MENAFTNSRRLINILAPNNSVTRTHTNKQTSNIIFCVRGLYIQNVQHDAQNSKRHINIPALMQPPFKFQSSACHDRHLIPMPKWQYLCSRRRPWTVSHWPSCLTGAFVFKVVYWQVSCWGNWMFLLLGWSPIGKKLPAKTHITTWILN